MWLALALVNIWVGVNKAGYTVAQELPIPLVVLGPRAVVAAIAAWQLVR